MISAAQLTALQADMQVLLFTSCSILRKTIASDGAGGTTDTWATLSSPLCRITPEVERGIAEKAEELRVEVEQRWTIALPAGQDVGVKDRITANGLTYEVSAVGGPQSLELERLVTCVEVVT